MKFCSSDEHYTMAPPLIAVHHSDQFYLLYKHLHTSLKVFSAYFRAINFQQVLSQDSINFATEIFDQDSSNFTSSLDFEALLTSIPLEETINVCTNELFENKSVHGLKKGDFKDLLSLAMKELYFIFAGLILDICWVQLSHPI